MADGVDRGPLAEALIPESVYNATNFDVRGWISAGGTLNTNDDNGHYNGPVSFNDRANNAGLDQLYLIMERPIIKNGNDFDIGGRFDMMYGQDAAYTFARGWDEEITADGTSRYYKLALPQLYAEANLPIGSGLSVKAGHFYTLLGYEVVTAPDNFFYSHSYSMQYGEPFTHFGVLSSYQISEGLTGTAGIVKGWDNLEDDGDGNGAFLGGITANPTDSTTVAFSVVSGNEGTDTNRTAYSAVVTQLLSDKWSYVLQHDFGYQEALSGEKHQNWYSLANYLIYGVNEWLSLAGRAEWFKDSEGVRVAGLRSGVGGVPADYYALSLGANIKMCDLFVFRPEIRWDHQDAHGPVSPTLTRGGDDQQVIIGANIYSKF